MLKDLHAVRTRSFCKILIVVAAYFSPLVHADSVWDHLDSYGFPRLEQKQALVRVMETAGIPDAELLLKENTNNQNQLLNNINNFMRTTQKYFNLRSCGKEYWEVTIPHWIRNKQKQAEAVKALRILGMFNPSFSRFQSRDAICILGTTKPLMDQRLEFAKNALPAKQLVLLAGERYVTADKDGKIVDGPKHYLQALTRKMNKTFDSLTETDLLVESYRNSPLFDKLPMVVINTPRRDLPRPTTATTAHEFIKWLRKNPSVKSVTFVSNQPHIGYQRAVLEKVIAQEKVPIKFDVIGPSLLHADDLEQVLVESIGALGSQIYAITPSLIAQIKNN